MVRLDRITKLFLHTQYGSPHDAVVAGEIERKKVRVHPNVGGVTVEAIMHSHTEILLNLQSF